MTLALAESLSTDTLDIETLVDLSHRTDPSGVLSIYLGARPGALRTLSIDVKNRLAELGRRLSADGAPERTRAVREAIARFQDELERLSDPEEPGRGRVLFAAIDAGWLTRVATQLPVPNGVVLDQGPFIHPLLELLDEGAPAGVVLASRAEARFLDWRLGELTPLREKQAEVADPPHERSGPVGSRPTALRHPDWRAAQRPGARPGDPIHRARGHHRVSARSRSGLGAHCCQRR